MTQGRQALIWFGVLAVLVGLVALFSEILLPFIAGLIIAYFLDPVADALERSGLTRLKASLLIIIAVALLAALALVILVPILVAQLRELASELPQQIAAVRTLVEQQAARIFGDRLEGVRQALESELGSLSQAGAGLLGKLLAQVWSGGLALVNFLSLLLVTPVVAFYILLDWDHMVARVDSWLPRDHAPTVRRLAREIDDVMAGFIRGQGTVALLLGCIYAAGLTWAGLPNGLLIGLAAGLITFVPFVGAAAGGIFGTLLALAEFGLDPIAVGKVIAVFVVGQVIEGNFLSPKIVGDRIKLHPVWLIFSLFAFGYLLGIVGLLIAVPVAAAIGVLARFAISEYQASPLYRGSGNGAVGGRAAPGADHAAGPGDGSAGEVSGEVSGTTGAAGGATRRRRRRSRGGAKGGR